MGADCSKSAQRGQHGVEPTGTIKEWDPLRDYLDTVVLLERLGEAAARETLATLDEIYRQETGASPLVEVVERLAGAAPSDAAEIDLRSYKGLVAPWNDWGHLAARGRHWAGVLAAGLLGRRTP